MSFHSDSWSIGWSPSCSTYICRVGKWSMSYKTCTKHMERRVTSALGSIVLQVGDRKCHGNEKEHTSNHGRPWLLMPITRWPRSVRLGCNGSRDSVPLRDEPHSALQRQSSTKAWDLNPSSCCPTSLADRSIQSLHLHLEIEHRAPRVQVRAHDGADRGEPR